MITCLVSFLVIGLAPLPEEKPVDDNAKLQGTWNIVTFEFDGKKLLSNDSLPSSISFEGNKISMRKADDAKSGIFKLDAKQKPPHFDITLEGEKNTVKLLYKLDGDTLILYSPKDDDGDRPRSYDSASTVITLMRAKK